MKMLFVFSALALFVIGQGGLLGAPEKYDKNDDHVLKMARFGLEEMNKHNKEMGTKQVVEILQVKKQVVAGTNYFITIHKINGDKDELCTFVVYEPLLSAENSAPRILDYKTECGPYSQGNLKGVETTTLKQAVDTAVNTYNMGSNGIAKMVQVAPVFVSRKEIKEDKGYMFDFTVELAESKCMKIGEEKSECPTIDNGMKYECMFQVEYKPSSEPMFTVKTQNCKQQEQKTQKTKQEMIEKLKGFLDARKQRTNNMMPAIPELLNPHDTLPIFGEHNTQFKTSKSDTLQRQKKDLENAGAKPLLSDIGRSILGAIQDTFQKNPGLHGKDASGLNAFQELLDENDQENALEKLNNIFDGNLKKLQNSGLSKLLGQDGHDLQSHGLKKFKDLLGKDDHDLQPHEKLIGGGDHDYQTHGKLIGGGDHDYQTHGKLIGGGDHDYQTHGKLIGGGDHDYQTHGKLIGGGDHDYQTHGKLIGGDDHDLCHLGHFEGFMKKHKKVYWSENEKKRRFAVFCENMKLVKELNENEKGTATYGATKFADLSPTEFREKYLSKKNWSQIKNHNGKNMKQAAIPKSAPESFDWRDHGAVTDVKNQGSCGSCWAFSTTGNIEGQWKIHMGKLVSLSEQELVDCDKLDQGCEGGLPSNAYMSIMKLGGMETEQAYKYKAEDEKCQFNKSKVQVKINGAVNISSNENDMAAWLAQNGPISIGINAMAMQFYFGGISHPWKIFCNPKNLDHGVLIVGYGVEGTEPYWIIKNSWGPDWGEKGYYRVYRGGGVCGLNTMCTSAVVN